MASRDVEIDIIGNDMASAAFTKVAGAAQAASDKVSAMGAAMVSTGRKLTTELTLPIVAIGAESVKMASNFQASMLLVQTQAGASSAEVADFSKQILALAGPTATAPEALATSLYHVYSTGLKGADALNIVKVAAEGAAIGHSDLEQTTNALTAAFVSGIPGVQNMTEAMGVFNTIVGSGDMNMEQLTEALSGTGLLTIAKEAGATITQVGAALAVLGDNGIRGADAATQLRMTMQAMQKPAAEGADALKSIGLNSTSLSKDLSNGGLTAALTDLESHMKSAGITGTETGAFITNAFGRKAGTGISILTDQLARYDTKLDEVTKGGQNFGESWSSWLSSTSGQFAKLKASLEATAIAVGNALIPPVTMLLGYVTGFANAITGLSPKMLNLVITILALAAALGPVILLMGKLFELVGFLISPMGLVVLAVAALAAAFVYAYDHSAAFREDVAKLLDNLASLWPIIKQVGVELMPVANLMRDLAGALGQTLVQAFNQLLPLIKSFGETLAQHKTTVQAVTVAVIAFGAAWAIMAIIEQAQKGMTALITSVKALNVAMKANTISIVIAAIAALAAGLIYAYTHSKTFRDIVNDIAKACLDAAKAIWFDGLKPAFDGLKTALNFVIDHWKLFALGLAIILGPIGLIGVAIYGLYSVWGDIMNFFESAWNTVGKPVFDAIKIYVNIWVTIIKVYIALVAIVIQGMWDLAVLYWNNIGHPMFNAVVSVIQFLWNNIVMPIFNLIAWQYETMWNLMVAAWQNVAMPMIQGVEDAFSFLWNSVIMPIYNGITDGFSAAWGGMQAAWNAVGKPLIDGVNTAAKGLGSGLQWAYNNVIKPVGDLINSVWSGISSGWSTMVGGLSTAVDAIKSPIAATFNAVIGIINDVIGALDKVQVKVPDWSPVYSGKTFGINIDKIPPVKLARGGLVRSQTLAVLGDNASHHEVALPLDDPRTIQALASAMAQAGAGPRGGGDTYNIYEQSDPIGTARTIDRYKQMRGNV